MSTGGTFVGDSEPNYFIGTEFADTFLDISYLDIVFAGEGDDLVRLLSSGFYTIDGGEGVDTLQLASDGLALSLLNASILLTNIENILLDGYGSNFVTLDAAAVGRVASAASDGVSILTIDGDAEDRIVLDDGGWTFLGFEPIDGINYVALQNGAAKILVEDGVLIESESTRGTDIAEPLLGSDYSEYFSNISVGDIVLANNGNDVIQIDTFDVGRIDGGGGYDTLMLDAAETIINLTQRITFLSIEAIFLGESTGNILILDSQSVLYTSSDVSNGVTTLTVRGDSTDVIGMAGDEDWTLTGVEQESGITYQVFESGNSRIRAEASIEVFFGIGDFYRGGGLTDVVGDISSGDLVETLGGDDYVSAIRTDFFLVDGGEGHDTLALSGNDLTLDLQQSSSNIQSIETIDLTGSGNNHLVLDAQSVLDTSDELENGSSVLAVNGNDGDTLLLSDAGWAELSAETINNVTYRVFANGAAKVKVEDQVAVATSTLNGTDGTDAFVGTEYADVFRNVSARDSVEGNSGNDTIYMTSTDVAFINGGDGYDTVVFETSDSYLNLVSQASATWTNIEAIDLGVSGRNAISVDERSVVTSSGDITNGVTTLAIFGVAGDTVYLTDAMWTWTGAEEIDGETFNLYAKGAAVLKIQEGVAISGFATAGTSAVDDLLGGFDDDTFLSVGANDTVISANGDDTVHAYNMDFSFISGWEGTDTLVLEGADNTLDLVGDPGRLHSVEIIDLSGTGDNAVILNLSAVSYALASIIGGADTLTIRGDAGDSVVLVDDGWTELETEIIDGITYSLVESNGSKVRIEAGVTVQFGVASAVRGDGLTNVVGDISSGDLVETLGGDDYVSAIRTDFFLVDGGEGHDTLALSGNDLTLDLQQSSSNIQSIETIDLTGSGNNHLVLDAQSVLDTSDELENGSSVLAVNGNDGDTLLLSDAGWAELSAETINNVTYRVFANGAAKVKVEDQVAVATSTLNGTDGTDAFVGTEYADVFRNVSARDSVEGNSGNDTIYMTSKDFAFINGGDGYDTVVFDGADLHTGHVHDRWLGIERIDLTGTGDNSTYLSTDGWMSTAPWVGDLITTITVLGDAGDNIALGTKDSLFQWTGVETTDGVSFNTYTLQEEGVTYNLRIQTGVSIDRYASRGTAGEDYLWGHEGDDEFSNIGAGDRVWGHNGNDTITIHSGDFTQISGYFGHDTIVIDGTDIGLDLTRRDDHGYMTVFGVEVFELNGRNSIILDRPSLTSLMAGVTFEAEFLIINGTHESTVYLDDAGWSQLADQSIDGVTYQVFETNGETILVQDQVRVADAPIRGTTASDSLMGTQQSDIFEAISTGDSVEAFDGDDVIYADSADFASVDGGAGLDTFIWEGEDAELDLTTPTINLQGIEFIDLTAVGDSGLVIDSASVLRSTDAGVLSISGDSGDAVTFSDPRWVFDTTTTIDGSAYSVYKNGTTSVRVQEGVSVLGYADRGSTGIDSLWGTQAVENFYSVGPGDSVLSAGGADNLYVTSALFAYIDGGEGYDTLFFGATGMEIDRTIAANVLLNIEAIDISGTGSNTLSLNAQNVQDVTGLLNNGISTLTVLGQADDYLTLEGYGWVASDSSSHAEIDRVFTNGDSQVLVSDDVIVVLDSEISVSEALNGTNGIEIFNNVSNGDTVHALDGDDVVNVRNSAFSLVDGGSGIDTLSFSGSGRSTVYLNATGSIKNVEIFERANGREVNFHVEMLEIENISDLEIDNYSTLVFSAPGDTVFSETSVSYKGIKIYEGVEYASYVWGNGQILLAEGVQLRASGLITSNRFPHPPQFSQDTAQAEMDTIEITEEWPLIEDEVFRDSPVDYVDDMFF